MLERATVYVDEKWRNPFRKNEKRAYLIGGALFFAFFSNYFKSADIICQMV